LADQQLIMDLGGRVCLSDDSHGVAQVGLNYRRMKDYLVSMGVKEIWHLVDLRERQGGDQSVGRRGRVVARRISGWETDPFWKGLEGK